MKDYSLVILAAGMGSRYGGTKQLDAITENGDTIMDFSLFDAIKAGFTKVVFIVRKDILEEVKTEFGQKLQGKVTVEYVVQETSNIPERFKDNQRTKPWGTGHALLVAKDAIKENFCVINADDFYGYDAFVSIMSFLKQAEASTTDYAMIGYPILNTLSENGSVSRGETFVDANHKLQQIIERTSIVKENDEIVYLSDNGDKKIISKDALVSMNFWGFTPTFLDYLGDEFHDFLAENYTELKAEFFLPLVVDKLIQSNQANVTVLSTDAQWMGVTYREDKENVVAKVKELVSNNSYPSKLW
ncbi:MAG: nucleotide-diphospho-sugar transferase [Flavobacteriaceae bacterium]|nr:nucleotide-diphospho-sugar transferase [Flavobacteriaceae bacterium]